MGTMIDNPSTVRYDLEALASHNTKCCDYCGEYSTKTSYNEMRSGISDAYIDSMWLCIDCLEILEDEGYTLNRV